MMVTDMAHHTQTYFRAILVANLVAAAVTILAAVRRRVWSYRLIGLLAVCASIFALDQVIAGRWSPLALPFTTLLVVLIVCRIVFNLWTSIRK